MGAAQAWNSPRIAQWATTGLTKQLLQNHHHFSTLECFIFWGIQPWIGAGVGKEDLKLIYDLMPTKTCRKANPGAVEMVLQLASSAWLFAIFVIVYTCCILLVAMKDAGWARRPQKITVLLPIIYDFSYSYTAWKSSQPHKSVTMWRGTKYIDNPWACHKNQKAGPEQTCEHRHHAKEVSYIQMSKSLQRDMIGWLLGW